MKAASWLPSETPFRPESFSVAPESIADLYPGSTHVMLVGLDRSSDDEVWEYARAHEFILVSKDSDFLDLSVMVAGPARLIWVRLGNCPTKAVESAFRDEHEEIKALLPHTTIVVLPFY